MNQGLFIAILSALSFSAGAVVVRKAAATAGESFSVMVISIFIGIPFFALAVTFTGAWDKLSAVSWPALVMLAAAGIIHFIIGRWLGYSAFRFIGANKATPYIITSPFYTLLLSLIFLKEDLTIYIVMGVLSMFLGAAMISMEKKTVTAPEEKKSMSTEMKGILAALGAAFCWGLTPVLIKPGVAEMGSSIAGAFVCYGVALVVILILFLRSSLRRQVTSLPVVKSIIPMGIAAVFTSGGQLAFFVALDLSPANVVTPLLSIQVIFIFFFSFLLNRHAEVFSWKVALGMAGTMAGTFLLFH